MYYAMLYMYVIYGSTTLVIAKLICSIYMATADLVGYNLTARCFRRWSTGLTERKLPMQYTISLEVYVEKALKPTLNIITLTV